VPRQARLSSQPKIHFDVAAGILCDASGRVLIAERLGGGPFHGMWEFPGGKIDPGEPPDAALRRELLEELGTEIRDSVPFMKLFHEYPDRTVSIEFFLVTAWDNEVRGLEGQQLEWVAVEELCGERLLPADLPVIEKLKSQ
jgi:8-oxo-dGTP diphosphatase